MRLFSCYTVFCCRGVGPDLYGREGGERCPTFCLCSKLCHFTQSPIHLHMYSLNRHLLCVCLEPESILGVQDTMLSCVEYIFIYPSFLWKQKYPGCNFHYLLLFVLILRSHSQKLFGYCLFFLVSVGILKDLLYNNTGEQK